MHKAWPYISVGNPKGKRPFVRRRRIWNFNIEMGLKNKYFEAVE
jgi:hypothetical protein